MNIEIFLEEIELFNYLKGLRNTCRISIQL